MSIGNPLAALQFIETVLSGLPDFLDLIRDTFVGFKDFNVGLIAGFWNGIIDLITGMLGLVKLLIDINLGILEAAKEYGPKVNLYVQLIWEFLDEFLQAIFKIDFVEVFRTILGAIWEFIQNVPRLLGIGWDALINAPSKLLEGLLGVSAAELGYALGYVAFQVLEFLLPFLKAGKASKVAKGLVQEFSNMADEVAKAAGKAIKVTKSIGKQVLETIIKLFREALETLRGGAKKIKQFIDELMAKFKKWLDDVIQKRNSAIDKDIEDFMSTWESKPVSGKGFLGSATLSRKEIQIWQKFLKEVLDVELRFIETSKSIQKLLPKGAAFFPESKTIWVRREKLTHYVMQHEMWHAEEFVKLGKDIYLKGSKALGGSPLDDLIRSYKREKYVFDKVMQNSSKFTSEEIEHAQRYFGRYVDDLVDAGVDLSKL